ncbi:MAG TPA: hypothetical protein VGV62_08690 [Xanthobacteraceae bacterium]|nr:hypothetical protein [Xanthobacteraceae bacterium]
MKPIELGSYRDYCAQSASLILDRRGNGDDPFPRQFGADHIADRQVLAGHHLLKIRPVAGIETLNIGIQRASNIAAVRSKQQNIGDVIGQIFFDLAQ